MAVIRSQVVFTDGSSVVNALSTQLDVHVHKNGKIHYQRISSLVMLSQTAVVGDTNWNNSSLHTGPRNLY